jgi:hypothetical protein
MHLNAVPKWFESSLCLCEKEKYNHALFRKRSNPLKIYEGESIKRHKWI